MAHDIEPNLLCPLVICANPSCKNLVCTKEDCGIKYHDKSCQLTDKSWVCSFSCWEKMASMGDTPIDLLIYRAIQRHRKIDRDLRRGHIKFVILTVLALIAAIALLVYGLALGKIFTV